jgi:hypothetical protein
LAAAIALSLALVVATCFVHYEGLGLLSRALGGWTEVPGRRKVFVSILCIFAIHLVEIGLYAVAHWGAVAVLEIGEFAGHRPIDAAGYFYFSAEAFTTLGLGDVFPLGELRLLTGIESLNGLLLIGWSISYTFYAMQRYWLIGEGASDRT